LGDIALDGNHAPPKRGAQHQPPIVTHVYCGQMVGWIKMILGVQEGLGPGHIALDRDPAPPPTKGHSPQFLAHVCCGQKAGWIKMPLVWR